VITEEEEAIELNVVDGANCNTTTLPPTRRSIAVVVALTNDIPRGE
jgi:hypothetical protein